MPNNRDWNIKFSDGSSAKVRVSSYRNAELRACLQTGHHPDEAVGYSKPGKGRAKNGNTHRGRRNYKRVVPSYRPSRAWHM